MQTNTSAVVVGTLVLVGLVAVRWELRRKAQLTAARVWRIAPWVLGPLAVVVIILGLSGHDRADDGRVVLTLGFAVMIATASIGQRWVQRQRSG